MPALSRYLDPKVITRVSHLELRARQVVEGFIAGLHKSPYRGFAVEFAQHRQYVPGDELRHLDWKVYGRSERYYIKQYEQETNLIATILLDGSESMLYASRESSKLEYAKYLVACLSYLILLQQDAVALGLFDRQVRKYLERSSSLGHIYNILAEMEQAKPEKKTNLEAILHQFAERLRKRGIVVIISDLFDNPDSLLSGLQHLRFQNQELIIFHILDPYELAFPFEGLVRFLGLEEYPEILCQPRLLKKYYLAELQSFIRRVREHCERSRADYVQISTDMPLEVALSRYLSARLKIRRVR